MIRTNSIWNSGNERSPLFILLLSLSALIGIAGCGGSTGPVDFVVPEGRYYRVESLSPTTERHQMFYLTNDSLFIADTLISSVAGSMSIDSVERVVVQLDPAGDGFLRGIETHTVEGSDASTQLLRYWYFFEKNDSMYFYRGIRLRGSTAELEGTWHLSSADSTVINASLEYRFTNNAVTITYLGPDSLDIVSESYHTNGDTLVSNGPELTRFGNRYEIIPGLALYLTTHANRGFQKIGDVEE